MRCHVKGADITDYFNYGFNEDTWTKYCEKQRRLRMDNNANKSGGNMIFVSFFSYFISNYYKSGLLVSVGRMVECCPVCN